MTTSQFLRKQMRDRRKQLGLKQHDMATRIGMAQQQYQRVEAGHDARFSTMQRIADGLKLEFLLVPKEHLADVQATLSALETAHAADKGPPGKSADPGHWSGFVEEVDD